MRKNLHVLYYQEVTNEEVAMVNLTDTGSYICPMLIKKNLDLWKKA